MPLVVSKTESLPAYQYLEEERVPLIRKDRAEHQDIRPLEIGILNLMPTAAKQATELQFLRLLANTPLQINTHLLYFDRHESKSAKDHLDKFYKRFSEIKKQGLDGLIITGANLEEFAFEDVYYWEELREIITWADENVTSTIYSCWASHAGLKIHYGLDREDLGKKMFGVYPHIVHRDNNSPFLKSMDDLVDVPYSRWMGISRDQVNDISDLDILMECEESGIHLLASKNGKRVFVQGHPEYDRETLKTEYDRDVQKGIKIEVPKNYFPDDDPTKEPKRTWVSNGQTFYSNWINHIYQTTNVDIKKPSM